MSWFIVNSTQSFSYKNHSGIQSVKKFDPDNPETAMAALEKKVKTTCPHDRRLQLLQDAAAVTAFTATISFPGVCTYLVSRTI